VGKPRGGTFGALVGVRFNERGDLHRAHRASEAAEPSVSRRCSALSDCRPAEDPAMCMLGWRDPRLHGYAVGAGQLAEEIGRVVACAQRLRPGRPLGRSRRSVRFSVVRADGWPCSPCTDRPGFELRFCAVFAVSIRLVLRRGLRVRPREHRAEHGIRLRRRVSGPRERW